MEKKPLEAFKDLSQSPMLNRMPVLNHGRSAAAQEGNFNQLPSFEPSQLWKWITSYLRFAFTPRFPFREIESAPNGTSIYRMENQQRISVAGDWGTGTQEAEDVAEQMTQSLESGPIDYTIHLGDVYYVGDEREVQENCLGENNGKITGVTWPSGARGTFALNGNHEMYASGTAYFQTFLPRLGVKDEHGKPLGQGPSFFCLENEFWRIVGIDTGYNSVGLPIVSFWKEGNCALPDPLLQWLRDHVKPAETPKATIILSHHQYFSGFDKNYPEPARQLSEFFKTPVLWLWGHEHRLSGYEYFGTGELKVFGRCVGHGGMPIDAKTPDAANPLAQKVLFYDARINSRYAKDSLGYNGFARLEFDDRRLKISYLSLVVDASRESYAEEPQVLLTETFEADGMNIRQTAFTPLCRESGFFPTGSVENHGQSSPALERAEIPAVNGAMPRSMWRQGRLLVAASDAILPPRCIKCNAPAAGPTISHRLLWRPRPRKLSFRLFPLTPIIVFPLLGLALQPAPGPLRYAYWHHPAWNFVVALSIILPTFFPERRATLQISLCRKHQARRRLAMIVTGLTITLGAVVFVYNCFITQDLYATWFGVGILFSAFLPAAFIAPPGIDADKIEGNIAFVTGVCPEFLNELPDSPSQ